MRRAPRLRPDQRIARYVTRTGRFSRIDPAKGTELPPLHVLGARLGWAVVVGLSFRRAIAAARADRSGAEGAGS